MAETTTTDLVHLREQRGLRPIETTEEGSSAERVANGVYGYTYSPAEAVPLFSKKTWHSFEVHKLTDGSIHLAGFVTAKEAESVRGGRTQAESPE